VRTGRQAPPRCGALICLGRWRDLRFRASIAIQIFAPIMRRDMGGDVVIVTGVPLYRLGPRTLPYPGADARVVNVDQLTYAADLANIAEVEDHERYSFEYCDVCRPDDVEQVLKRASRRRNPRRLLDR
jgi:hypothetical protein